MNDNKDVPIRDAATVILLRQKKDSTYVLMGQRGNKAAFMPSKYVFPGGAVDEDDANVELFKSINKKGIDLLHQYSEKKIAKELSVAAIRELWEEAGLRLCAKVENIVNVSPGWEDFCNGCYLPDASNLEYVFRAITPPGRPRRFDARFFICRAENVYGNLDDFSSASELIALSSVKSELFVGSSSFCVSSTSIGSMVSFWLSVMLSTSSI